MSKYTFDRMGPDEFEAMAKALLEALYRIEGNLVQFGEGKDGAREATWTQRPTHPTYRRPANQKTDVPKEWVFQVKYHDLGQRGWGGARDAVVADLQSELTKLVRKYKVPCHAYVMITNVPFTGARNVGTRDRVTAIAKQWEEEVPEILVWDAGDLSRMLDGNEAVRTAYLDHILPGDVLKAIYKGIRFQEDRRESALRAYLAHVVERDATARAEEAGDEPGLRLEDVFVDLSLKLLRDTPHESVRSVIRDWLEGDGAERQKKPSGSLLPGDFDAAPASFALLLAQHPSAGGTP